MKNKKYITIALGVLAILTVSYILYNTNKKNSACSDANAIYERYKKDVDTGIEKLMNLKEFQDLGEESKVDRVRCLLDRYSASGEIRNVYYDENTKTYTFQYKDGILGGVMLKSFDPNMN